jgi:AraC-like DNA-binding protein
LDTASSLTLINPKTKAVVFKIAAFDNAADFAQVQNINSYTILLILKGKGKLRADFSEYDFEANSLVCLSIYQPFMLTAVHDVAGIMITFHPDFFCIHKHQQEVACNGVLFNSLYSSPLIKLGDADVQTLLKIIDELKAEMQNAALAQYELLISYLKIFLINASRMKLSQNMLPEFKAVKEPFILQTLKDAIEVNFKTKLTPGDYADLLNITPRALNRIKKNHFNRTLTNLIAERIIIEAKRELYLTAKPVKKIAYELGFTDEFYFSRFFKSNVDVSPQAYRETVGFARGEVA